MAAYRRQRALAFAPSAKLDYLEHLLHAHRGDRAILFTQDNATAYADRPALPRARSSPTRRRCASGAPSSPGSPTGTYRAVATSKVLNEGVDVPDANVAVVLSGSGSVREHVQRLGRILRKRGRQARRALRARHRGDDRDVHQRAAAGAQCLPLIS